jgi:hypothetical protein
MLAAGVPESNEKKDITWNRCPERRNLFVFRQLDSESGWLVWGWKPSEPLQHLGNLQDRAWAKAQVKVDEEPRFITEVWLRKPIASPNYELALRLGVLQPLDALVNRWGPPPSEVLDDWVRQISMGGDSKLSQQIDASALKIPLCHLLAFPHGRLLELDFIEDRLQQGSRFAPAIAPSILLSPLPTQDSESTSISRNPMSLADLVASDKQLASSIGSELSKDIASLHPYSMKTANDTSTNNRIPLEEIGSRFTPNAKSKITKPHIRPRTFHAKRILIGCSLGGLIGVSLLWMRFAGSKDDDRVISEMRDGSSTLSIHSTVAQPTSFGSKESDQSDATSDFKRSSSHDASSDSVSLELSHLGAEPDGLSAQADQSIQTLMTSLGANASDENADANLLTSVQEMFAKRDSQKVVEEALLAPSIDMPARADGAASTPFSEPLASNDEMTLANDANKEAEPAETDPKSKSLPETGSFQASRPISKSMEKATFRMPFRPQEKKSICRVQLDVPKNLLYKPEDPYVLLGRQDVSWTVALEDDTVSLRVYLRSKPARAWYIATAVRVKLSPDVEFPIGPSDAINVCSRLQNYLASLDKQRSLLEAMKSKSKLRGNATDAIKVVDKEIKQTDGYLKTWREIQELVAVFYSSNRIRLDFASSEDTLPPMVAVGESETKE